MRGQMITPIPVRKSVRRDEWRGLTSLKAGVIAPVMFFPLLREDRLRGRLGFQVKMSEAVEVIVNPIRVSVTAYLVPKTALARFEGSMETLNRSYQGETLPGGSASPPWYVQDSAVAGAGDDDLGLEIYDKLGVHYKSTTALNTDLVESYNTIVNWRRAAVSKALTPFNVLDHTLKPAFWDSPYYETVKPSFDAALMEGAVPVTLEGGQIPIALKPASSGTTPGIPEMTDLQFKYQNVQVNGKTQSQAFAQDADGSFSFLYANLATQGSISLANIELARQTQAFAKLRERFTGLSDEYLVDLLMQGIRVPPEDFREPVLIGRGTAVINQQERYATDGASLDVSVANGVAQLSMTINTPAVNPGGMVIVCMEIVPEQLHERREDLFLKYRSGGNADHLPNYLRDYLDPQKVEVVPNSFADIFHSAPDGVFGYGPLNKRWDRRFARVGGKFKRPVPDAFVEDRQRIWVVEKDDPVLGADFYTCPQPFPHTVFADADADPFEVIAVGMVEIVGNTIMGATFEEDENSYEKVLAQVDTTRISSEPSGTTVNDGIEPEVIEEEVKTDAE